MKKLLLTLVTLSVMALGQEYYNLEKSIDGCENGNAGDCATASYLFQVRHKDKVKSKEYALKSHDLLKVRCDANDGDACYGLSASYDFGSGVPENQEKAAQYLKKGCELNNVPSCFSLGWKYYEGKGIEKNKDKACEVWKIAAKGGDKPSQDLLMSNCK